MFIETQETPNPHTMKFIPGVQVLSAGIKSFSGDNDLKESPLAASLFQIDGVKGVFLTTDFITVTKSVDHDWSYLKPIVLAAIVDHLVAGLPICIEGSATNEDATTHDDIAKQVIELIETRVRPAVAQDGGDIIFKDFQNGIVYVELHGSCSGCPSSTITLKSGIENMLKHYIPEIISVEAV
jgi:Fe-S cluster biogenesis protein NfuA